VAAFSFGLVFGSPPRAWGRRTSGLLRRAVVRFTPTCVGKTPSVSMTASPTPVHPHVRGEDVYRGQPAEAVVGSPPRAWGRLRSASAISNGVPVHPHVRGEDLRKRLPDTALHGSPPRAWGRPPVVRARAVRERFTPTCVGKTTGSSTEWWNPTVHPHVRGEDSDSRNHEARSPGSPPRAWGRRVRLSRHACIARFTPTCVGKTPSTGHWRSQPPVHPHVRGEDAQWHRLSRHACGSPPRAWGRRNGA